MITNNIKELWAQASICNVNTQTDEIIRNKHCRIVKKYIADSRKKAAVYCCGFIMASILFIYAFLWLKLSGSLNLMAPLVVAGLFLFLRFIVEWRKCRLLQKDYDLYDTTKSEKLVTSKLKRIKLMDFISYLVLFYSIAIVLFIAWNTDQFVKDNFGWIVWTLIIILLGLPWLIRRSVWK